MDMDETLFAVIVAGGSGRRMDAAVPKQYLEIGGIPIIVRTVKAFLGCGKFGRIIVLVPEGMEDMTLGLIGKHLSGEYDLSGITVTAGGKERNDTVMKAVRLAETECDINRAIFVTHDAVRPFVTDNMIEQSIAAARAGFAASAAIPLVDTVFEVEEGLVKRVPDREALFRVQTPQSFNAGEFKRLYENASPEERASYTDSIGVFIKNGRPVRLTEGSVSNIKITYPDDLTLAESFVEKESV